MTANGPGIGAVKPDGLPLATHGRAELHPDRALLHQSRDGHCTPLDTH